VATDQRSLGQRIVTSRRRCAAVMDALVER
jgi:hypothetical protein